VIAKAMLDIVKLPLPWMKQSYKQPRAVFTKLGQSLVLEFTL
jgi:hypothetical protein